MNFYSLDCSDTSVSYNVAAGRQVFIKYFNFPCDVPIRIDYVGKHFSLDVLVSDSVIIVCFYFELGY